MQALDRLIEKASAEPHRIVLPEGTDPRVLDAAVRAAREGVAKLILNGDPAVIEAGLRCRGANVSDFRLEDPATSPLRDRFVERYLELRRAKGATEAGAVAAIAEPNTSSHSSTSQQSRYGSDECGFVLAEIHATGSEAALIEEQWPPGWGSAAT